MKGKKRTYWIYLVPVLLLFAVTLPHLEQGDFRVETAHYGAIGLQAWRNPDLFWSLHEHPSVPYFNKPPLVFWIHGLILHLFGVTLSAARLPAILAAAGCVVITTSLARRFMGRMTAVATGTILALSYEFFRRTREISLDMWQLLFMMAAVWLWAVAARCGKRQWAWLAGVPLGLALLCKPLMALIVPCILIFWLFTLDPTRTIRYRDCLVCVLTALVVALPWHIAMVHLHGDAFTRQYFGHEVAQRMQGLINQKPAWYYGVEIGRTYWPWMLLLVAGLAKWQRGPISRHHRNVIKGAVVWIVVWGVLLTIFPDKRPRYALPLYPMMAIISGYGFSTLPWRRLRDWYRHWLGTTAAAMLVLSLIISVLPIRFQAPPDPELSALVTWAKKQDPSKVYTGALSAVDESMIYLKAGYWPTPLSIHPHPEAGSFLIYHDTLAPVLSPEEAYVFHDGPYRVTRK